MTSPIDPQSVIDATGGLPPETFVLQDSTTTAGMFENSEVPMDLGLDTTCQFDPEFFGTLPCLNGFNCQFPDDDWDAFLNDTAGLHFDDPMQYHEDPSNHPAKEEPTNARQRFSPQVKAVLEQSFVVQPYPGNIAIKSLAEETGLSTKQVKTWFMNKRSRTEPPSLPLSVSNVQNIPEADRAYVTMLLAPSVMAVPTRGCSRNSRRSRLTRDSLERLEKENEDPSQASETRAYSLFALRRYFEDALDFEEIVLKYTAGSMGTAPIQREAGDVAVVTSENCLLKRPRTPAGSLPKDQAEGASTRSDDTSVVSSTSSVRSTKRRKTELFYCTEFPPCQLSFRRAEHLARHIGKHIGKIPFECHCSRRFSRLDNLRQHAETVHVNEEIPADSLAAPRPRFQRPIRTARVKVKIIPVIDLKS